jgi:hypothetical protein
MVRKWGVSVNNPPPSFGPICDGLEDDIDLQLLIREFAVECCLFDQRQSEKPRDLFSGFKRWMKAQGRSKAGSKASFVREFRRVLPYVALANVAGGRVFAGIGLRRVQR